MYDLLIGWLSPALTAAIIAAVVSLFVSRRTNYINSVTAQRSMWIEKLRGNIAKYSSIVHTMSRLSQTRDFNFIMTSDEYQSLLRELQELVPLIKLQLNRTGPIDKNIIALLERIPTLAESRTESQLVAADHLLIEHSQWLLKAEWEKVKAEAGGIIYRCYARYKAWQHLEAYNRFLRDEGSIGYFMPVPSGPNSN